MGDWIWHSNKKSQKKYYFMKKWNTSLRIRCRDGSVVVVAHCYLRIIGILGTVVEPAHFYICRSGSGVDVLIRASSEELWFWIYFYPGYELFYHHTVRRVLFIISACFHTNLFRVFRMSTTNNFYHCSKSMISLISTDT